MTTYADLLYEMADLMLADAAHMEKHIPENGRYPAVDGTIHRLREQAEKIHEALRTSSAHPALSTEDVERIKKRYDPTGSMYQDIHELAESHEAIRREKDTATSIAERITNYWTPGDEDWYSYNGVKEHMTQDQIDWFEARK